MINAGPKKRILITGSGGPLGVNVSRSLKHADEPVFLLGTECNRYHLPLSLTDQTALIPPAKEGACYLDAIASLVEEHRIDMILPTHPVEVRAMAKNRNRFPGVRFFLPPLTTIMDAQNKWSTFQRLSDAQLPVPRTFLIQSPGDVLAVFDTISTRPIWFRGAGVPGQGIGVASLPCRESAHAEAWVDHHHGWGGFIASEYLPGRNLTWCGIFCDGNLVVCQTRERLEYVLPHVSPSGITGAPAVSRTIHDAASRRSGEAAVRVLDSRPHGVFFVDFKGDEQDLPRITEINGGRFGTTIHFYTEAGCNFPHIAVKLAFGEKVDGFVPGQPIEDPIEPNTYWIRTLDCGPALVRNIGD